jgi:hypothetical protein
LNAVSENSKCNGSSCESEEVIKKFPKILLNEPAMVIKVEKVINLPNSTSFQLNLNRVKMYITACSPCIGPTTTITTTSKIAIFKRFPFVRRILKVPIAFFGSKKSKIENFCAEFAGDSVMKKKA